MDIAAIATTTLAAVGGIKTILLGLATLAALTPTEKDDNAIHRVQNLVDMFLGLFKK